MREKLIRDKVIDRADARGETLYVRVASEEEMPALLEDKLIEEAFELRDAKTEAKKEDELADVIEVVLAIVRSRGHLGVYSLGIEKYQRNGGFTKRLVLRIDAEPTPAVPVAICTHPGITAEGSCTACGHHGWLPVAVVKGIR